MIKTKDLGQVQIANFSEGGDVQEAIVLADVWGSPR